MSSLHRLEKAGINIVTSLVENLSQVMSAAGIYLNTELYENGTDCLKIVIGKWESGNSLIPPTWKSLLDILKDLHLEDLSLLIKIYFGKILSEALNKDDIATILATQDAMVTQVACISKIHGKFLSLTWSFKSSPLILTECMKLRSPKDG